ncbi:U-box domain-containing protein [Xylariaceae sp. FL1272]|nr:U-box domain-containing protein [Xylariaceae sp. FL1272]
MGSANPQAYDTDMEDWEVFSRTDTDLDSATLVGTTGPNTLSDGLNIAIHPLASQDGVIVSVQTPQRFPSNNTHVPCDIVLVLDVSGSMSLDAPAPVYDASGAATKEHYGLSVLDLVKHAAHTIVATLNEGDRLGIIAFSNDAKVVQTLTPMGNLQKKQTTVEINELAPQNMTNLWAGIQAGLRLFEAERDTGRVPSLLVLTDGMPNYMNPAQGYVPKLQPQGPLPAQIHTFGFGYEIQSGLLKSIAEAGSGNYSFIPDSGMIATVFVHAVAHLQTTYATKCTLEISAPAGVQMKLPGGSIDQDGLKGSSKLTIRLGNLQYGQSRDIYLPTVDSNGRRTTFNASKKLAPMRAKLTYSLMQRPYHVSVCEKYLHEPTTLPVAVGAYHQSRWIVCEFLSSFFKLSTMKLEYIPTPNYDATGFKARLRELLQTIPSRSYDDDLNKSIMEDVRGQITEALSSRDYFQRWGCHYFLSLWNAHSKQLCNSFKDAGPMRYNQNLYFIACRDALDEAFDRIPPPEPSTESTPEHEPVKPVSMAAYSSSQSASRPCFSASSSVLLSSGHKVAVGSLRPGIMVQTRLGSRMVEAVVETPVTDITMCRICDLLVTPWHPIKLDDAISTKHLSRQWVFPVEVAAETPSYTGCIYSVLLEPDQDIEAHTLYVGGVWAVTLGHGMVNGDDVRAHAFLGHHATVSMSLMELRSTKDGVYLSSGVKRDAKTGLVCGFEPLVDPNNSAASTEAFPAMEAGTTIAV